MRIGRCVTFVLGREGFPAWKLYRLKMLASYFRSEIILQNITTGEATNAANTLRVMSLGCKGNNLCQIWIEGADAELACMVLTDFIDQQFDIIPSRKRNKNRSYSIIESHLAFNLSFSINYYFEKIQVCNGVEKHILISKISTALNNTMAHTIAAAMIKREKVSSTGIGNNIAIPHIMIEGIEKPSLAVFRLDKSINWNSKCGEVSLIIAMLIPAQPTLEVVKAFTQITRSLLEPIKCNLLTSTEEPEIIKAILFHFMARDNKY